MPSLDSPSGHALTVVLVAGGQCRRTVKSHVEVTHWVNFESGDGGETRHRLNDFGRQKAWDGAVGPRSGHDDLISTGTYLLKPLRHDAP